MLEKVHQHIVSELRQGARTDTIFVVTAVAFNLIVLGVNSAVAGEAADQRGGSSTNDLILTIFVVMTVDQLRQAVFALHRGHTLSGYHSYRGPTGHTHLVIRLRVIDCHSHLRGGEVRRGTFPFADPTGDEVAGLQNSAPSMGLKPAKPD